MINFSWWKLWATYGVGGAMAYSPELFPAFTISIPEILQWTIVDGGIIILICTVICSVLKVIRNIRGKK